MAVQEIDAVNFRLLRRGLVAGVVEPINTCVHYRDKADAVIGGMV